MLSELSQVAPRQVGRRRERANRFSGEVVFWEREHAHATTLLKTLERDVERQNAGKKPRCFL